MYSVYILYDCKKLLVNIYYYFLSVVWEVRGSVVDCVFVGWEYFEQ